MNREKNKRDKSPSNNACEEENKRTYKGEIRQSRITWENPPMKLGISTNNDRYFKIRS
ncbi:hypothetical protein [Aquimarina algiphila]|uniref:hypothetical protein n=1 Tax=Aquimarina algiphila TaxID=2047982 RepID=UPI00232AF24F|nr:hypothetical protein [Aquimarina algiphila]